jgi:mRNA interferase RelE/StbE
MVKIIFLPPAQKYLKKLKDNKLKSLYKAEIDRLLLDPYAGEAKSGDLSGIYCCDIRYNKTDYRLAYTLVQVEPGITVVVVMAGTHENFYENLKRYMKSNHLKNL